MKWEEVRAAFSGKWVLIEALRAYTDEKSERILEEVALIQAFDESKSAMHAYQKLHSKNPHKEFYVLHTSRKFPAIQERRWVGIRRS